MPHWSKSPHKTQQPGLHIAVIPYTNLKFALNALKIRAGLPGCFRCSAASCIWVSMIFRNLRLRAKPNTKSTRLFSHQLISSLRQKPESPRSTIFTYIRLAVRVTSKQCAEGPFEPFAPDGGGMPFSDPRLSGSVPLDKSFVPDRSPRQHPGGSVGWCSARDSSPGGDQWRCK